MRVEISTVEILIQKNFCTGLVVKEEFRDGGEHFRKTQFECECSFCRVVIDRALTDWDDPLTELDLTSPGSVASPFTDYVTHIKEQKM